MNGQDSTQAEADSLIAELQATGTSHARRLQIGQRLDALGDPRAGVGLREDGLPDIDWLAIGGGAVRLEDETSDASVDGFYIARFPVTHTQYQAFIDDGGYRDGGWWAFPDQREAGPAGQAFEFGNYPRDNVNWYEASAFCLWLNARYAENRDSDPPPLPDDKIAGRDWVMRLPTEWEWQQAATGGNAANKYPWGAGWDPARANTLESGLDSPTAVGMYPLGAGDGPLDMCGNVWEWCLPESTVGGDPARHGGSWRHDHTRAHTGYRNFVDLPHERFNNNGLRVVFGARLA